MKKIMMIYVLMLLLACMLSSMAYADTSNSALVTVSLVNQNPDPALAGDVVEVRVGIENTGGVAAENILLEFVPEYPFVAVTGEDNVKKIGTLNAYQYDDSMQVVKFKVMVDREATAGEYGLKIKEYENGKTGNSVTKSFNISVQSKQSAEVIHIDKTTLVPGKQTRLKFTINNVGNAPLRDLTFSWVNSDKVVLPVGGDNTKYIKYIDIGTGAEMEYQVIADSNADAGLYKLDLQLTYDDAASNTQKTINTIAGVYVGGGTDFDIAFSESSGETTSFTVANVGSNPAFSVSVIVPQQQGWSVSSSNSMIIGNLNTGDYTVASFGLQSSNVRTATAGGEDNISQEQLSAQRRSMQTHSPLKVQIAYTDTMGNRQSVEKEVSINLLAMSGATGSSATGTGTTGISSFGRRRIQQQSFFSKYKWYIYMLIVLMVFGWGYNRYRKGKLLDADFKFADIFRTKGSLNKKSKAR